MSKDKSTEVDKKVSDPKAQILLRHLEHNRRALLQLAQSTDILKHTGNIGVAREGFISAFLKNNLPNSVNYYTGEIIDAKDVRSGQIDIILHHSSSVKFNIFDGLNIFPVETVLCAIEVKSNLCKEDMKMILNSCYKVKSLRDYPDETPYIAFAYKGSKIETINTNIKEIFDEKKISGNFSKYLPDIIINLEEGFCLVKCNKNDCNTNSNDNVFKECYREEEGFIKRFNTKHHKQKGNLVLWGLFKYLIEIINKWDKNPEKFNMKIDDYAKKIEELKFLEGYWDEFYYLDGEKDNPIQ